MNFDFADVLLEVMRRRASDENANEKPLPYSLNRKKS